MDRKCSTATGAMSKRHGSHSYSWMARHSFVPEILATGMRKVFFFFTDRLKRMINASGYKVWPAEVESIMYQHPDVQECCIIAAKDDYRGETVKAVVVKTSGSTLTEDGLIAWSRGQMAAYKVPRLVSFVETLPKSATGKVQWRQLQEAESSP